MVEEHQLTSEKEEKGKALCGSTPVEFCLHQLSAQKAEPFSQLIHGYLCDKMAIPQQLRSIPPHVSLVSRQQEQQGQLEAEVGCQGRGLGTFSLTRAERAEGKDRVLINI